MAWIGQVYIGVVVYLQILASNVKKMGDEKTTSLSQFPSNALGSAALVAKGPG